MLIILRDPQLTSRTSNTDDFCMHQLPRSALKRLNITWAPCLFTSKKKEKEERGKKHSDSQNALINALYDKNISVKGWLSKYKYLPTNKSIARYSYIIVRVRVRVDNLQKDCKCL